MKLRLWTVAVLLSGTVLVTACDVRDAFRAHTDVAARAGEHELGVDRLAQIVANATGIPVRADVLKRVASLWVDYTLFAQRIADQDSLLDSLTVMRTMWNAAQLQVIGYYHDQLVKQRVTLDSATVDSVYNAGDRRLVSHILVSTDPDMSQEQKASKLRKAQRLRAIALRGRAGWARANAESEDSVSKLRGGSLGILGRGQTVPQFERVAFALAPGEVSAVTETDFGYHIIRRPPLSEARQEFREQLNVLLIRDMDAVFLDELEQRWAIEIAQDAPRLMRLATDDLDRGKRSHKAIGRYNGGQFTVGDFVRWLQALPTENMAQVTNAADSQLVEFAKGLVRNTVLEKEAREAGYGPHAEDLTNLKLSLSQRLSSLRQAMGLDSSLVTSSDPDKSRVVDAVVDRYLAAVTSDVARLITVPPALGDMLRSEQSWRLSAPGLRRALERSRELRVRLGGNVLGQPRVPAPSDSTS
ncbi:MAG: peptidylprolyl isomerase [Gemmatimonadales bacterium]